ncbi:hypothetical protein VKT23_012619 [Stygiomarasmius scandens]|uniref:F-box domain-containing protein n=1 Tax=Marasmiellus scandens TaxID=2682957 RepID=A0ABR1J6S6_9AGAR
MARRSERLANTSLPEKRLKLRRSPSPQSEYEQDSDSDYFPSAERHKRRSKKPFHTNLIPMEILTEIFSYLDTEDILHLSRTCRDLRGILSSITSDFIWRHARCNAPQLPPLPKDLSEIKYAHLLFDQFCDVCGRSNCNNVSWDCRLRCCKKCFEIVLVTEEELRRQYSGTWSLISETNALDLLPGHETGAGIQLYSSSVLAKIMEELLTLQEDSDRQSWVSLMVQKRHEHLDHVELCIEWAARQNADRLRHLQIIRSERRQAIIDRLTDLGWGREVRKLDSHPDNVFSALSCVKRASPLTERGWTMISPLLIDLARKERYKSVLRDRHILLQQLYHFYIGSHPSLIEAGHPPFGDIIQSKIFHHVIWETPIDQVVAASSFDDGFSRLPAYIERWVHEKTQDILEVVQDLVPYVSVEELSSADTVLLCRHCKCYLWYPAVFGHSCDSEQDIIEPDYSDAPFDPFKALDCHPWRCNVVYTSYGSSTLRGIMKACGLAPGTTLKLLEELNPIVECLTCARGTRLFMRWNKAVSYIRGLLFRLALLKVDDSPVTSLQFCGPNL